MELKFYEQPYWPAVAPASKRLFVLAVMEAGRNLKPEIFKRLHTAKDVEAVSGICI